MSWLFSGPVEHRENNMHSSDAQPVPLRVLTSLPRSGTHWLKFMISYVLGMEPLERRLLDREELRSVLETEARQSLIYEHLDFDTHCSVLDPAHHPGLRIVLLYRNPVDALISAFNRYSGTQRLPDQSVSPVENLRLYLDGYWLDRPLPERCREDPMLTVSFREWVSGRAVKWCQSGYCLSIRYEDLVEDTKLYLRKVLDHLLIPYTRETIDGAIARNTFQELSGGRDPGTVDVTSHYRRGIPGEWREVLNEHDLEVVHREIGDYLHILGYEMKPLEIR